ncbi:helix-turn-helix domain-containing protein [Soonwooa sp.]|uniref:helix-turn-helix domain-containing protein n=1 Tax=Soonwooa sp. TaxID=1938592 RepID=UPI002608E4BE|nr:helix-turn-helix domain-containing protein [Soonwooa sp.]
MTAQIKSDFEVLYNRSYTKLYQNPDDCIMTTQSNLLNVKAVDDDLSLQQILGQAYMLKAEFVQSVRISLSQESQIMDKGEERPLYFDFIIAEQYHNLKLFDESKKLLNNLIKDRVENRKQKSQPILFAKIYQLQAVNYLISKDYSKATEYLRKSDSYLTGKQLASDYVKFENTIFKSSILIAEKKTEEAKSQLLQLKVNLNAAGQPKFLFALACEKLSNCYFLDKNYQAAIQELELALEKLGELPYILLKRNLYSDLSKNYLALNDMAKYESNNKLFLDLNQKINNNQKEGISYLIKITKDLEENNIAISKKKQSTKSLLIFGFTSLLVLVSGIYLYTEIIKTKNFKKQILFLDQRYNSEGAKPEIIEPEVGLEDMVDVEKQPESPEAEIQPKIERQFIIPAETQKEILDKLTVFENSDFYLNKDISIAVLAIHLDTNTKYLSDIINTYKGKNFNAYINELRINYIVSLLEEDPTYLNYKVSYLAEKAGFSSHSLFAAVFKTVTGISPNIFIKQLKA